MEETIREQRTKYGSCISWDLSWIMTCIKSTCGRSRRSRENDNLINNLINNSVLETS